MGGLGAHDLIDLPDTIVNHRSFFGGVLTLSDGLTPVAHLNFNGAYSTSSFSLTTDHHGGTLNSLRLTATAPGRCSAPRR